MSVCPTRHRFGVPSQADYNTRFQAMTQPQKKTRRQMLEEFVTAKPNDAFARYGLAMEHLSQGDAAAAAQHFRDLLGIVPDYVPAYMQGGQALARLGRIEEARELFRNGIAAAQKKGETHAAQEMEGMLDTLD